MRFKSRFILCLCISNRSSTVYWKGYSSSIELILFICQNLFGHICVGLFPCSFFSSLSICIFFLWIPHSLDYCSHIMFWNWLDWFTPQIDYILCSWRWRSSIQSAKTRPGADCGSDHEFLIAKFRLKLKKVGKPLDRIQVWPESNPFCELEVISLPLIIQWKW